MAAAWAQGQTMSVEQAGAALGIGRENVKSRLLRARRKLWTTLAEPGATPGATSSDAREYTGDEEEGAGRQDHE